MASENKKRKDKNSFCQGALKTKKDKDRMKRILFYTSSRRKYLKEKLQKEKKYLEE